jgi:Cu-processing system ATP-binding protein
MVQRLGLAVAALPDARAFLLDEPTSSLDPDGLCAFYGLAERWRREGRAVLFSSHQLGDVERLADRIAVLVDGRLVADLGQRELCDRLAARGIMRVRVDACPPGLVARLAALAPGSRWTGEELVVPGAPGLRAAAIDAVRAAGAEIRGLTAEEGRLEALYRELVEGAA